MTYQINYAYACHTGKVRANNEDNFWCCGEYLPVENKGLESVRTGAASRESLPVLAVFDGMGGESCGETAAFLAAEEFGRCRRENAGKLRRNPELFLRDACKKMNEAVCAYGKENKVSSMGTTMAMTAFGTRSVLACNLGDSRIYRMSGSALRRISTDHVLGGSLFGKAPLTQYLGLEEENMALEPAVLELSYQEGDKYLVCSDGITDMLSDREIEGLLKDEGTVEQAVSRLMERALEQGGRDNITVILCEIEEQKNEGFFARLANTLQKRKA